MEKERIIDKLLAGGIDNVVYYVENVLIPDAFKKGKMDGIKSQDEYEKGFKAGYKDGYK